MRVKRISLDTPIDMWEFLHIKATKQEISLKQLILNVINDKYKNIPRSSLTDKDNND